MALGTLALEAVDLASLEATEAVAVVVVATEADWAVVPVVVPAAVVVQQDMEAQEATVGMVVRGVDTVED